MREIKFRAWDKENNQMVYVGKLHWHHPRGTAKGQLRALSVDKFCDEIDINDFILMQFTGLFDKNGKEIYEEDILSFVSVDSKKFNNPYRPFVVYWIDKDARFSDWSPRNHIEIIGNIYENPNLLADRAEAQ